MADQPLKETTVSFKDTLNLPKTDFPIRPQAAVDDPALIARWQQENLYIKAFEHNSGKKKFILHDGPPYANGHIHLGHAYNKILKDIVTKSQRMMGKHVPVTPGWDCHGLPIELKVTQENPGLKGAALKKACREYANKWIEIQKEEFKRLGVVMDWDHPYLTMSHTYEAAILRSFGMFVDQGYIERKNKTVPWCPSDQTVLASAEIEYQERKDPSLYVLFPLEQALVNRLFPNLAGKTVNVVIWTTTPWTLPLNRAVLVKPGASYVVLDIKGTFVMVAEALADTITALLEVPKNIVAACTAEQLGAPEARAHHPFVENLMVPLILSENVSLDDGTAFVHCAPGCGPEDYEVGVKNNLEIYSPITPDGKYAVGIAPQELQGMAVSDGQIWVIKKLAELGKLLYKTTIRHSYPHCWRCRNGLIFRATKQWFCNLEKHDLREKAIQATDTIQTLPENSINRLMATIGGRLEWVLSRQRVWGVPIPAFMCAGCDYTYISKELVDMVAAQVEKQGIEYWDHASAQELLPKNFSCPRCKGTTFTKEHDILDVWFDSGVSHYAVLKQNPALAFPADMYLEGKDQHRGWFQSSLLTAMVIEKEAPMRTIVTHGYTVDAQGRKMSKSLGNVVSPQEVIDQVGTDGLRLWASSIDCSGDVVFSPALLENIKESFRKIRNTCRFLLSNLYDYNHVQDALPVEKLLAIDQYALHELAAFNAKVLQAYERYDFTAVFHAFSDYSTTQLSAFYLDIIKDRLYVEQADGHMRRSAQTVCWYILDTMTKLMAPILSCTAEQISDNYQQSKKDSIHLQSFASLDAIMISKEAAMRSDRTWNILKEMRSAVLKVLEGLREKGIIKHSLEARVTLFIDPSSTDYALLQEFFKAREKDAQGLLGFFKEFFIVSQMVITSSSTGLEQTQYPGLWVHAQKAEGHKCPRCWQWTSASHNHGLCDRCFEIVEKKGNKKNNA